MQTSDKKHIVPSKMKKRLKKQGMCFRISFQTTDYVLFTVLRKYESNNFTAVVSTFVCLISLRV